MTTEARSLVEWVNSFGKGTCEKLTELSSGTLLFKCMKNVIPTLSLDNGQEWTSLFKVLTEFCDCSLEQSVDRELVESGNEEHLARAAVLLLCLAVQRKPNEDVISRITTLPYKAQCDIMYFIEEALAKMKSNALSSGLFTSGVGDVIPAFSERIETSATEERDDEAMEQGEGKLSDDEAVCSGRGPSRCSDSTPQPTPNRLKSSSRSNLFACPSSIPRSVSRHQISRTSYYQGLESPAAVQWMQSQRKPITQHQPRNSSEELLKLQHKVRVLEKSLHNEQTLSQEMHAALCQREQEYHDLEASYQKAQAMAEKVRELSDVQDELQTMTKALQKSQKSMQRFQREVEEQQMSRDREMEHKLSEISHLETENTQLKELLEKAVADQLEQKSEVKRLQLSSETAAISFQAKQREHESLLQLNQEYSYEISKLRQQCASLQQDLTRLYEDSNEKEKLLTDENQMLSLSASQTQDELSALRDKYKELGSECQSVKQQVTVAEVGSCAVLEQYQTVVEEMEGLRTHCKLVEGQLQEARSREELQQAELRERGMELSRLQSQFTELKTATEDECREVKGRLAEKERELLSLKQTMAEQIRVLEEQSLAVRRELAGKEEEVCELQKRLSEEVQCLQQSLHGVRDELEKKERELSSVTQTAAEQRHQTEEVLSETHQKLNSLTERYTTEAEEMAAVKASLEEDLVRVHSELREIRWSLAEKERVLSERQREVESGWSETEALKKELQGLRGAVEVRGREREQVSEERDKFGNQLQDMAALLEVKEQRWFAEKTVLENRSMELSSKLEMVTETMTQSLREAEQRREKQQIEWEQEKESWVVQTALLEEQLKNVTEELQSSTAKTNELERESKTLRRAVDKAESIALSLQAEVAAKCSALVALERTLSETRAEGDCQKEEGADREQVLTARVERLTRQLTEVDRERGRIQKEFEHLSRESEDSLAKIETKYQTMSEEMERTHQIHCTELNALQEANSVLQCQQSKASAENTSILQKQSELYKELCTLQETKSEIMDLCRQYESAYNEERERRKADREQIRKMRNQNFSESESAANEANSLRKQLSGEKRITTRLGAENKSLKAQVSFLEQKLRDMEKERRLPSPPKTSQRGHKTTYVVPPSYSARSTLPDPRQNTDEFYSQLQHEFDSSTSTQIPSDISAVQSHDGLTSQGSEMTLNGSIFPSPQHQSTTVKQQHRQDNYTTARSHTSSWMSQETKEEGYGGRISELKKRNHQVLPHLKSYYAVEMQQKNEDPCIVRERVARPQRKRAVGANTSIKLASGNSGQGMEDSLVVETRKRTTTSRKATGDLSFSGSPAPSRRRISEPLTPQQTPSTVCLPSEGYSRRREPKRTTMAPGYSLREYLKDEEENRPEIEGQPATMFEMKFSPPCTRVRELPERLRQRLSKQEKPEKPLSDATTSHTSAATGGRKAASVRKHTQKQASKRLVLKTKN